MHSPTIVLLSILGLQIPQGYEFAFLTTISSNFIVFLVNMWSTAQDGVSHCAFPAKQGTFWQGSCKVINKRSVNSVNRMFVQSLLIFHNVLIMLAPKGYLYIMHGMFFSKMFQLDVWNFFKCYYLFKNVQRTFHNDIPIMSAK